MRASCFFILLSLCSAHLVWSQSNETPYAVAEAPVNAPIPDDSTPLTSTINIPGSVFLSEIQVALPLTHPDVSQLLIELPLPRFMKPSTPQPNR